MICCCCCCSCYFWSLSFLSGVANLGRYCLLHLLTNKNRSRITIFRMVCMWHNLLVCCLIDLKTLLLENSKMFSFWLTHHFFFEDPKKIDDHLDLLWNRQNVDPQVTFKESLRLELLTNLEAKGAKRSVIKWVSRFFQKYFVLWERKPTIRSKTGSLYFGCFILNGSVCFRNSCPLMHK